MLYTVLLWTSLALGGPAAGAHTVFVTSNGWHTDITVARADIPADLIPERADFPAARYLQFGWGDANYYATPDPGLGTTLGAAFPGPAVMHVAGLAVRPSEAFRDIEEVALTLSADSFARLVAYLHASFDRGNEQRAQSTGRGVYAFSLFYTATGEFHLFNTCNTWTATALQTAGVRISADGVQRADDVMEQLREPKSE